jgi:hypothetical protein
MAQSCYRIGNYTEDKYKKPELDFDEYLAELKRVDAEMRAAGEYDD